MEELFELRTCIEQGRYHEALALVEEMEEMSRDDKINKIHSHAVVLIMHLIKQHAQNYSTRSWRLSIENAAERIAMTNKRRKSGGCYLNDDELEDVLENAFRSALRNAALEAFEGKYEAAELGRMVDAEKIRKEAFQLIMKEQTVVFGS